MIDKVNYEAVAGYMGVDYSKVVPALVEAWNRATTFELKDSICDSEIINQVDTPTTVSVFYKLTFQKIAVTVLKIFVAEEVDSTCKHDHLSVVDDEMIIVDVEVA